LEKIINKTGWLAALLCLAVFLLGSVHLFVYIQEHPTYFRKAMQLWEAILW
jgi:hypothetical protein